MAIDLKNYDPALMQGANIGVSVDLTDIVDSNGNEVLEIDGVASAVNYVAIENAATGNGPDIEARGDDTNIDLNLVTKGTGKLTVTAGSSGVVVTSASANGLAVGANGSTNPVLSVVTSTASVATGISITGAAAAGGVAVATISSGTNENLTIDAKGSGTITLGGTSTGNIVLSRAINYKPVVETVTAANVITAAETGSVFFLNSATEFASTLPAPAAGLKFTFIVTAAPSGADYTITTNASANIVLGQVYTVDVNSATDPDFEVTGGDTVSFVSAKAVVGDRVDVISNGTNWFVYGFCSVFDAITITTAS